MNLRIPLGELEKSSKYEKKKSFSTPSSPSNKDDIDPNFNSQLVKNFNGNRHSKNLIENTEKNRISLFLKRRFSKQYKPSSNVRVVINDRLIQPPKRQQSKGGQSREPLANSSKQLVKERNSELLNLQ